MVVSKVVVFSVLKLMPSKLVEAFFVYMKAPPAAIDATPAAPIALTVKNTSIFQCLPVVPAIVTAPVVANITLPVFILIVKVWLLTDEIWPVSIAWKLSPTLNPSAGILKLPKPPSRREVSVVVLVIGVLAAV